MLNRRKHPQNIEGAGDEREALLSSTFLLNHQLPALYDNQVPNQHLELSSLTNELATGATGLSRAIDIPSFEPFRQAPQDFIYYTIQPGDSLQNISVKYSCPVASIKRLNNLWSDQEFYGLSRLKLPAGKLRLIADVISAESGRGCHPSTPYAEPPPPRLENLNQVPQLPSNIRNVLPSNHQDVQLPRDRDNCFIEDSNATSLVHSKSQLAYPNISDSIFKDLDMNIEKARTAARCYNDSASAIMQSLALSSNNVDEDELDEPSKIARREAETLLNDMSDYGLSYNGLILFIFIVCLVCPLAYVIYLEETHHNSNKAR